LAEVQAEEVRLKAVEEAENRCAELQQRHSTVVQESIELVEKAFAGRASYRYMRCRWAA
jgi:hypothetical protein